MSQERLLSEPEAYNESFIMCNVFHCFGKEPAIGYDFASMQIDKIRQMLSTLTDESLLALHGEAYEMHAQVEPSEEIIDAAELLEDALDCLPHLDLPRALRVYRRLLDDEDIDQNTREIVPSSLSQLTLAAGDAAMPVWRQVLSREVDLEEHAKQTVRNILKAPDHYGLSDDAMRELADLALIEAPE